MIAAGPFSGVVGNLAGLDAPLSLVRRQKLVMPATYPEVPSDAPMTIEEETGAHWRPALHGAYLLWTAPGYLWPSLDDVPTSVEFAFGLLDPASDHSVARISPFWAEVWKRHTAHWSCKRGNTPTLRTIAPTSDQRLSPAST